MPNERERLERRIAELQEDTHNAKKHMDRCHYVAVNEQDPVGKEDSWLEYEKYKKEYYNKKSELDFYENEIHGLDE